MAPGRACGLRPASNLRLPFGQPKFPYAAQRTKSSTRAHVSLRLPGASLPALCIRHAPLRPPLLRPARLGPASQPLQMGLSLHPGNGSSRRNRIGASPFLHFEYRHSTFLRIRSTPHPLHLVHRPSRPFCCCRGPVRPPGRRCQLLHSFTLRKPRTKGCGSFRSGPSGVCRWTHVLGIPERRHRPLRRLCACGRAAPVATHKNG